MFLLFITGLFDFLSIYDSVNDNYGLCVDTHEMVNGQSVPVTDSFRQYDTLEDSVKDYGAFLKANPRYAEMLKAEDIDQQIIKLGQSGYATDPEYADKIASIAKGKRIGGLL